MTRATGTGAAVEDGAGPRARTGENRIINVLRAVAALLVVVGHVRVLLFQDYAAAPHSAPMALLYAMTSLGPSAVIVFFVLSGYWVGGGALEKLRCGTFTWRGYASSRLTRLWLVLVPALILTWLVDHLGLLLRPAAAVYTDGGSYADSLRTITWSIGELMGNLTFLQSIAVDEYGTDKALWSLANEFWYYLIFPAAVLVFLPAFSGRARWAAALVAVAGALVAGPAILALFPAWLLGAVVASQRIRLVALLERVPVALLGAARMTASLATLGAMVLVKVVPFPTVVGGLVIALPAGLLISLLAVDLRVASGWGARLLGTGSWLAGSSYSLYVTHLPLAVLVSALAIPDAGARWTPGLAHLGLGLLVVVLLVGLGALFAAGTERRTEAVRRHVNRIDTTVRSGRAARGH